MLKKEKPSSVVAAYGNMSHVLEKDWRCGWVLEMPIEHAQDPGVNIYYCGRGWEVEAFLSLQPQDHTYCENPTK